MTKLPHSCGKCDARWSGLNTAHCAADGCHRTFSGVSAFDLHRIGGVDNRSCDVTQRDKSGDLKLVQKESGTWGYPSPESGSDFYRQDGNDHS